MCFLFKRRSGYIARGWLMCFLFKRRSGYIARGRHACVALALLLPMFCTTTEYLPKVLHYYSAGKHATYCNANDTMFVSFSSVLPSSPASTSPMSIAGVAGSRVNFGDTPLPVIAIDVPEKPACNRRVSLYLRKVSHKYSEGKTCHTVLPRAA
jgi:hypothetical protein